MTNETPELDLAGPWELGQTGDYEAGTKETFICDKDFTPFLKVVHPSAWLEAMKIIDAHNDKIGYMDPKRAEVLAGKTP